MSDKDTKETKQVAQAGGDIGSLSGVEKSALLMLSLTPADAAQIFRNLEPKQVQKLGMEMAALEDSSQSRVSSVHRAFIEDVAQSRPADVDAAIFISLAAHRNGIVIVIVGRRHRPGFGGFLVQFGEREIAEIPVTAAAVLDPTRADTPFGINAPVGDLSVKTGADVGDADAAHIDVECIHQSVRVVGRQTEVGF